jgi:hypothetical protein
MAYLKVPYSPKVPGENTKFATVEEVKAALPTDVEGLFVEDSGTNYPCVQFPDGVSVETMQKVERHLKNQGFEVS